MAPIVFIIVSMLVVIFSIIILNVVMPILFKDKPLWWMFKEHKKIKEAKRKYHDMQDTVFAKKLLQQAKHLKEKNK